MNAKLSHRRFFLPGKLWTLLVLCAGFWGIALIGTAASTLDLVEWATDDSGS